MKDSTYFDHNYTSFDHEFLLLTTNYTNYTNFGCAHHRIVIELNEWLRYAFVKFVMNKHTAQPKFVVDKFDKFVVVKNL